MVLGSLVQAAQTAVAAADRDGIRARTNALAKEFKGRGLDGVELEHATNQAYWFTICTGVGFALMWLILARAVYRGRPGGRVIATVLALVYVFTFVFAGLSSMGANVLFGIALCCIAIAVVYLLWRRPVTAWMNSRTSDPVEPEAPEQGGADDEPRGDPR